MTAWLKPEDTRDLLRLVGGLLLGLSALALANRKEADWGAAIFFLVYLIPAVVLFGAGALTLRDTGELRPWQAVFNVFGLVFVPLTLFQFVDMIGGAPDAQLNIFWIFAVTAALAAYAGLEVGIRFQLLVAGLAFLVSFLALCDEVVGFSDTPTLYRLALVIVAAVLLYVGVLIWRNDREQGLWKFSELLTAAGVAAVLAFGLGVSGTVGQFTDALPFLPSPISVAHWYWDVALLGVSIALIAAGTLIALRGPVYIGAIGLFVFSSSIGSGGTDVWWPAVLLLLAGGALALSFSDFTLGKRPRELIRAISGHPVGRARTARKSTARRKT